MYLELFLFLISQKRPICLLLLDTNLFLFPAHLVSQQPSEHLNPPQRFPFQKRCPGSVNKCEIQSQRGLGFSWWRHNFKNSVRISLNGWWRDQQSHGSWTTFSPEKRPLDLNSSSGSWRISTPLLCLHQGQRHTAQGQLGSASSLP